MVIYVRPLEQLCIEDRREGRKGERGAAAHFDPATKVSMQLENVIGGAKRSKNCHIQEK